MSARHFLPGGYPNPDPYYVSPEEEAALYDGPPDWDEDAIPEAEGDAEEQTNESTERGEAHT